MVLPQREISGVCEITTGAFTVEKMPPAFTGEVGALRVSVRFTRDGEAYQPGGALVEMYLYHEARDAMTPPVRMTVEADTAQGQFGADDFAASGSPLLVLRMTETETGALTVACALPLSIRRVLGHTVLSARPATPSEVVYVGRAPYVDPETLHWMQWDNDTAQFVDSGVHAYGGNTLEEIRKAEEARVEAEKEREAAIEKFENATFEAKQLPAGADPTLEVTEEDGHKVLTYGIPEGKEGKQGAQGETGPAAGFGKVTASVDGSVGTPSVEVTASGNDTAKNFDFKFHNLKGIPGEGAVSMVWGALPDDAGDSKPEVGGTNLILGTKTPTVVVASDNRNNYAAFRVYSLAKDQTYTVSCNIQIDAGNIVKCSVVLFNETRSIRQSEIMRPDVTNGRLVTTITVTGEESYWLLIYAGFDGGTQGNGMTVSKLKFEKGVVPTDWSPAPEDLESLPAPVTSVNGQTGAVKVVGSVWGVAPGSDYDTKPEVGGTNLYVDTKDFSDFGKWLNVQSGWVKETEKFNGFTVVSKAGTWTGIRQAIVGHKDEWFTLTGYAKADEGVSFTMQAGIGGSESFSPHGKVVHLATDPAGDFVRYSFTFKVLAENVVVSPRFEKNDGSTNALGKLYVCGLKVERGVVPTDWSPAPEDLESATGNAYTPSNPPPYPVSSVNGKTGAVTGLYDANNPPPYPIRNLRAIAENADLDSFNTPGHYYYYSGNDVSLLQNAPENLPKGGFNMIVIPRYPSFEQVIQIIISVGTAIVTYMRYSSGTPATFWSWKKLTFENPVLPKFDLQGTVLNITTEE